jgi:membrane protease YdiL (CAAX protease family)
MWLFVPATAWFSNIPISMRPDWPAILLGVILVNGVGEEIIHRGFLFHHLRRRWPFARAATAAAIVFALQHLYLIATIGWAAGMASVVLALLVAFPFAYAFEYGGRSIVAPAILHTCSNAPMLLFVSPEGPFTSLLLSHMAVVLLSLSAVPVLGTLFADVESNGYGRAART